MNYQPWEFIVVRDKEVMKKLVHVSFGNIKMPELENREIVERAKTHEDYKFVD